ncbi:hypothetical protein BAUCODRAFT_121245 [Baudoinia panamericana UAMH 10762]|uniref:Major facilitator superfamily (MFS) profile domain-containing protein n=1 Tax=Baudoinia panamericana (strain UAMH 10762) TaxID=717646 RepID=M2NH68_BAUPA|nr:uncharacterized protein BAUCODRAFT_121245 [Baudoinia panamericana UAMH 10762]EMC98370.1 hypothetical protein BAUCODRAFT_121245 [Baudoinia panamericana UAMH 10762]
MADHTGSARPGTPSYKSNGSSYEHVVLGKLNPCKPDVITVADVEAHLAHKEAATAHGAAAAASLALHFANDGSGRRVLREENCYSKLGFCFPQRKKWRILIVLFIVQISMNFNAAIYPNAVPGMKEHFHVDGWKARLGQMVFLVAYAFGCELWAPWSEELGRKWVLQGSLFLVNLWQIPCALAPSFWVVFGFRFLGGLSSAGGSVTLGMVADMYEPNDQQFAVAFVVLGSVASAVITPIAGGAITQYLPWQWVFWISLIFGALTQALQLFLIPETRASILVTREAKRLRNEGTIVYSQDEIKGETLWKRLDWQECCTLMWRPYQFLIMEPIVRYLSLLSGFSDALIFIGLDSFGMVLKQWHFNHLTIGLSFIALLLSYIAAYFWFFYDYKKQGKMMRNEPDKFTPERRLWLLLFVAPLLSIGLFGFAWASLGPRSHIPWILPILFTVPIGIANFAVYMATIDYMIAAYGPYAASATGGNGFCRDLLAGLAALFATPFYNNVATGTKYQLTIPSLILSGIALLLIIPVYYCYAKGPEIRAKSKYASQLAQERAEHKEERQEAISASTSPDGSGSERDGEDAAAGD